MVTGIAKTFEVAVDRGAVEEVVEERKAAFTRHLEGIPSLRPLSANIR